jgi:hypothetical protein
MRFGGILKIYSRKEIFMFGAVFVMRAVNWMQLEV